MTDIGHEIPPDLIQPNRVLRVEGVNPSELLTQCPDLPDGGPPTGSGTVLQQRGIRHSPTITPYTTSEDATARLLG